MKKDKIFSVWSCSSKQPVTGTGFRLDIILVREHADVLDDLNSVLHGSVEVLSDEGVSVVNFSTSSVEVTEVCGHAIDSLVLFFLLFSFLFF